jgi:hypothetical protein
VRIVVLGVALVFALSIGEAVVRATGIEQPYTPVSDVAIALYSEEPNGPVRLTPNWRGHVGGRWTEINADGFRGSDIPPPHSPGTMRIVFLGDSYTMGDGVALEESYPKQVEQVVRKRMPCEVINCAVSATNSMQQIFTLRDALDKYRPQVVLLGYNVNDFRIKKKTRFQKLKESGFDFDVAPDGRVSVSRELGWLGRAKEAVRANSYLYRLIARIRAQRSANDADVARGVEKWMEEGGHERSFDAIARMNELCAARGVRFRVFITPGLLDTAGDVRSMDAYPFHEIHEQMIAGLSSRGVSCRDASGVFSGFDLVDLVVHFPLDRHFNPDGNRMLAEFIARESEDLLKID